ncbi:MAG: stage II sporulation protein M [Clostridia bacterium]|nr:stage II sporulation protein M [Clostridia bacterium]
MRTVKSWSGRARFFAEAEQKVYIWLGLSFAAGIVLATVSALTMPQAACEEMLLYLKDFFQAIGESGADSGALLKTALFGHAKNFVFLFLCSVMVIGAPFIVVFSGFCGFVQTFTVVFLFRLYGVRTLLFFCAGMLPHYLLSGPCYVLLFALCLQFSLGLFKEKQSIRKRVVSLLCKLGILFAIAVLSSLLQAYIEPLFIGLISGLYT